MRHARRIHRRELLGGAAALVLAPLSAAGQPAPSDPRAMLQAEITIDMHSHAGRINRDRAPFEPVAEPMREGGMAAICLAMVADSPVTRPARSGGFEAVRQPRQGELAEHGRHGFERILALIAYASLGLVTDKASLAAARGRPSVIVAAEGGDFLEGALARLDEAHARYRLRHLQLTHYRVNELGDIQTAAPVHGGLTSFGAEVVRACNRLGIVIDVAHATLDLVKQAAALSSAPLVLSHTALSPTARPLSRLITVEHAKVVAATGGVIGVWPVKPFFRDLADFARGFARMADAVGVEHVGFGSDMLGLPGGAVFETYRALPDLVGALQTVGFGAGDIGRILGGNYARVFAAAVR